MYEPLAGGLEAVPDFRHVDGAVELLRSRPREPFAIYLPLSFPHCPYHAPEPFHTLISPDAVSGLRPPDLPGKPDFHRLIRETRRLDRLDEAFFRRLHAVYLGMIAVADALLGMLLDALEETGHDADTAVFLFSVHGDWAGDYGLVEKWPSRPGRRPDPRPRVPLVGRAPGAGMARGHVVREPVELFDVMATALDLAGVPARHTLWDGKTPVSAYAAYSYTWCNPPKTGRDPTARTGPARGRPWGRGVSRCSVRCGRSRL